MTRLEQISEGLIIASNYEGADICAEHDCIYLHPGDVSDEHNDQLVELGWFEDDDSGGWCHYV